eukprot:3080712-Karenia_brevis.AAC.1
MGKHRSQQADRRKQELLHSPYSKASYKYLRQDHSAPLIALQDPSGAFITDPMRMDALLRQTWQKVYQGNVESFATTT